MAVHRFLYILNNISCRKSATKAIHGKSLDYFSQISIRCPEIFCKSYPHVNPPPDAPQQKTVTPTSENGHYLYQRHMLGQSRKGHLIVQGNLHRTRMHG
ncbi:hypothetical protein CDAR_560051 [Caerostris darwini]|uniref:Uncharacterized protein n=1 Tax=Caerostris darwini TaxID=1538125 RepID=A0AAV4W0A2_9ARAC|nr:hypothetical protein CDAR_560051 [Caerostris darwini]